MGVDAVRTTAPGMILDCTVYQEGRRRHAELPLNGTHESSESGFVWVDLEEATAEELESVARDLDLGVIELGRPRRPTAELFTNRLLLVLRTACHVGPEQVECGELTVVAGTRFVVTARRGQTTAVADARAQVEAEADLSRSGPGPAVRAIMSSVLRDWEDLVLGLYEDVDRVEELVLSTSRMYRAERIYTLMRELMRLDRAIAPLLPDLEAVAARPESIAAELAPHLLECRDRAQRLLVDLDHLREQVSVALQIHQTRSAARLAQVSVRHAEIATHENEQMRKIAAWAAIVGAPTLITGIYGMNFDHMPELDWTFGYPLVLGVMALLCVGLYRWFQRIDWL